MESTAARLMPQKTPEDPIQVAVQSLNKQLELALRLLDAAAPDSKDKTRRTKMIEIARDAYQNSVEALGRLPALPPETLRQIFDMMRQFRTRLADVDFDQPPKNNRE